MEFLIVPGAMLAAIAAAVLLGSRLHRRRALALPPIQRAEFDRVEAEMERLRLPLCRLLPTEAPPAPLQSRIGGGPWAP